VSVNRLEGHGDGGRPDARPADGGQPVRELPDRAAVLAAVTEVMVRSGRRWAWQGSADAPARWVAASGPKDLDLWCDRGSVADRRVVDRPGEPTSERRSGAGQDRRTGDRGAPDLESDPVVAALRQALCAAVVAGARDARRLRHVSLAVETPDGPAVVDLTVADLRVGPVLLVPAAEITVDPGTHRLTGVAAVADLLVRPILRGRWPEPARLDAARVAWAGVDAAQRRQLLDRLTAQLGRDLVDNLVSALGGGRLEPRAPRRARIRMVLRSLAPGMLAATWAQRRTVLPAGPAAGPLGLRIRGVVVAVVGTDGAGKSTVGDELHVRLRRLGMRTGAAYFGMARGNLPGVTLARRLLGVAPSKLPTPAIVPPAPPTPPRHPQVRKVAAWFYAVEYAGRYLLTVAPLRARRRVVIVDRWVYDLRESPWPGSPAARVIQRLIPDPDILVLPDAPVELIHRRKPERPFAEQAAQQERYRRLLEEGRARFAEMVVDTSGATGDPLRELVAAVLAAAHRAGRGRRRQ